MNVYTLSRNFWDWAFENPDKVKPNHSAMYFFAIEHCNRLGWKEKFGFPTSMAMEALGIKSYKTYVTTLKELVEFGFIKMVESSKNQYSANIIALVNFTEAPTEALTKARQKHVSKQVQSTVESIVSIDKHIYNNTILPINNGEKPSPQSEVIEDEFLEENPEPINSEELKEKKVAPKKENEVVEFFNKTCIQLSKVQLITESRKKKITARISEVGFDKLLEIITDVSESGFLNGDNPRSWTADFDWILEPRNFTKILEGNYKNKEQNGNSNTGQSNSNSGNATGHGFKNTGKVSARTILAKRLADQNKNKFSDSDGGNFTVDAEIVN